jgi:hypothetical protein
MILCDDKHKYQMQQQASTRQETEALAKQIFNDFVVMGADFALPENDIIL